MRFWDTSALVPLVVEESSSEQAVAWLREDEALVVWTLTPVEAVSALERRVREGALAPRDGLAAEEGILDLVECAHEVAAISPVKTLATRLLRTHALRAADALQLAAALLWAEGTPAGAVVHTFDERLALAAAREGFRVIPSPFR